jgi:hypothetical protein
VQLTQSAQQPIQQPRLEQQPSQLTQPVQQQAQQPLEQPAQPVQAAQPLAVQSSQFAQPVESALRVQSSQQPAQQPAQQRLQQPLNGPPSYPAEPAQPLQQPQQQPPQVQNGQPLSPLPPLANGRNGFVSAEWEQTDSAVVVTGPSAQQVPPAAPSLNSFLPTAPQPASANNNGSYAQAETTTRPLTAAGIQPGIQRVSGELDILRTSLQRLIATTDPLLDGATPDSTPAVTTQTVAAEPAVTGPYAARNLSRAEYAVVRFMQSARQFGRDLRALYGRE